MLQKRKNSFGQTAEDFAVNLLIKNNYKILQRNFHSRFGEIDVVAIKDGTLVFVEVKARRNLKFGYPEEAVTGSKLIKIRKAGEYFALTHPQMPEKIRIDVVALLFENGRVLSSKIIKVF